MQEKDIFAQNLPIHDHAATKLGEIKVSKDFFVVENGVSFLVANIFSRKIWLRYEDQL